MEIKNYNEPFPYMIIDDYYDEKELELIWEELVFLSYPHKLKRSSIEGGASFNPAKPNELLEKNYHSFLDGLYRFREMSNILSVSRKLFSDNYKIFRQHPHWFFQNVTPNNDFTQVAYYENDDEFGRHRDSCIVTALTWLYQEPKKFMGGDLFLGSDKMKIECINNRTLIFPSMLRHTVNTIKMEEQDQNKKQGRFCITQFCVTDMTGLEI
tara:strand:+ start:225 stop:857 length:633 start_codon:yes stop_codon:yes gene_type:complete